MSTLVEKLEARLLKFHDFAQTAVGWAAMTSEWQGEIEAVEQDLRALLAAQEGGEPLIDEDAEAAADKAGAYGAGPETGDHPDDCKCRICFIAQYHLIRPAPAAPDALREAVRWFAGEMERQLRANDAKSGWEDCGRTWLVGAARTNLSEILRLDFSEKDAIVKAAADAANFCLMIADNRTYPRPALAPRKEGT